MKTNETFFDEVHVKSEDDGSDSFLHALGIDDARGEAIKNAIMPHMDELKKLKAYPPTLAKAFEYAIESMGSLSVSEIILITFNIGINVGYDEAFADFLISKLDGIKIGMESPDQNVKPS